MCRGVIDIPEEQVYICNFLASPESIEDAFVYCRKYLNSDEETEFTYALMFMLYGLLKYEGTTIGIDSDLRERLEALIKEKKSRRKKRG